MCLSLTLYCHVVFQIARTPEKWQTGNSLLHPSIIPLRSSRKHSSILFILHPFLPPRLLITSLMFNLLSFTILTFSYRCWIQCQCGHTYVHVCICLYVCVRVCMYIYISSSRSRNLHILFFFILKIFLLEYIGILDVILPTSNFLLWIQLDT